MKRITIVGIAVAVVLVSATAYMFYDLNGESMDFSDREMRLIVTGSMDGGERDFPISTIPIYSLVMIEHLEESEFDSLVPGDVLAFYLGNMLVVHRIISIDPESRIFVTQGDANPSSETVAYDDTIGEVVGVSPLMGNIVYFLQTNFTFILVGIIAVWGLSWGIGQIRPKKNPEDD